MELAPAGRREGEEGVVGIRGNLVKRKSTQELHLQRKRYKGIERSVNFREKEKCANLLAVGLLEILAGRGLSRPALSSFATRTMVSFIPSFTGSGIGFQGGILEMHS